MTNATLVRSCPSVAGLYLPPPRLEGIERLWAEVLLAAIMCAGDLDEDELSEPLTWSAIERTLEQLGGGCGCLDRVALLYEDTSPDLRWNFRERMKRCRRLAASYLGAQPSDATRIIQICDLPSTERG